MPNYRSQKTTSNSRGSRTPRRGLGCFIIVLVFIVLFVIAALLIPRRIYNSTLDSQISLNSESVKIIVEEGSSTASVLELLKTNEVIKTSAQEYTFRYYVRENNLDSSLQAGSFSIPNNSTIVEITEILQNAKAPDIWVTIPEGLRKDQIASLISEQYEGREFAVFSEQEFIDLTTDPSFISTNGFEVSDLEGYLYPDRYLLPLEANAQYVLTAMLDNFKNRIGDITYEELIVASMIEREGYTDFDRPKIADVIWKRLEDGETLGIDATLLYYYKDWKYVLTFDELNLDQPYNTRLNPGLPPTPISNPGKASIDATLNPETTSFYFYIHDTNGQAYFAENLQQHNSNIVKYLQ